ncbi:MAG: hypothetical protein KBF99_20685 [Leptospiraceae bacterium]|nr:hypothetical protein [Leptospiraceae bacterium]MBK9502548.1 hypothetical protein [Leptospiraceae bacterium]MBP9165614.1 hypothetical protein [Leptospiraceae bacterium]
MIFETVNEINEAIKAINYASYLIRLCALNSQISIARISYNTKKSTGFTPISVELIRISALIEEKASQLFLIMFESLRIITEEAKFSRNKALQEKFFREYKSQFGERKFDLTHLEKKIFSQYDEKVDELKKSFHIQFTSFRSIIKETIKLCKNSRPIVFSVKIESVYIENHQAAFDELSVELSNFISKIESILKKIELLNLELIEDK